MFKQELDKYVGKRAKYIFCTGLLIEGVLQKERSGYSIKHKAGTLFFSARVASSIYKIVEEEDNAV